MQSDRVNLHRVSADGLEQVIREVTELARRKGNVDGAIAAARLRSVVEFLLRPSLVQVRQLAAMGSAYTDAIPKPQRPKVVCPRCGGWVTLTRKKGGFIYPTHKVSAHAGRCSESGLLHTAPVADEPEPEVDD